MVWAFYHFTADGMAVGWGALPTGVCDHPDRCGEKLQWLDDNDLALVDYRPAGAA
jgi:hypothetical protein